MSRVKKRKSPSRIRYEESHPTISCRVTQELYDKLKAIKEQDGQSFADILKVGLGILELDTEKAEKMRQQGHQKGYKAGYAEASSTWITL